MLPVLRNTSAMGPFATGPVNRLDGLFNRFFGEEGGFADPSWSGAPIAMWEDDDHIFIEADVPGMTDKDVDVTVHNGMLFIRCVRTPEEGRRYVYDGRSYGRFERAITLPEAVNTEDVQATLTDGVLRLVMAKSPEAKPKKITLKTSS
jgi:HSP20 family protein